MNDNSTHNHRCDCNHEDVKYCKRCNVVHCLNCSLEWISKPYYYNYPYYLYSTASGPSLTYVRANQTDKDYINTLTYMNKSSDPIESNTVPPTSSQCSHKD